MFPKFVNQNKKENEFTCRERLERTIPFNMMVKESPNATAEIKLDYVRKKSNQDAEESFDEKTMKS